MKDEELDELVRLFIKIFGYDDYDCVNVTGKSMATGHNNYYDIIFYNTTSFTYQKFSYLYRKYLQEISSKINSEIRKQDAYKGFYYWSPSYHLKFGEYSMEFGRKAFDKKHLEDYTTDYYFTTNCRYFIDKFCNNVLKYKKLRIKENSIYD